ncbi:hypothetical protein C8Q76DRAFT_782821 [Earliella scabrosa]|nr:hypothetical protein C8Q76DRAFT_782821 [Earliella scabrosa]
MSYNSENAQIISTIGAEEVVIYINIAVGALLAYEYIVTLDREVNLFWTQKITMASVLFIANRYIALFVNLMYLPYDVTLQASTIIFIRLEQLSPLLLPNRVLTVRRRSSCKVNSYISTIMQYSQYIPWAVFSAMRAFALSSRTWPLALGVFVLSLGPSVINFYGFRVVVFIDSDGFGCGLASTQPVDIANMLTVVSRSTLIIADLLVLAVTWKATFKTSRENVRALGQRMSLSAILFRDGVIYFVTLAIMNVLHLSFTLHSHNWEITVRSLHQPVL